jgi:hypothetical protein
MASRQRDKPIESIYKVGDVVYFHAYAKKDKTVILLCKGIINRLPIQASPVYKVIITNICKTAIGSKDVEKVAGDMVGMVIPCLSKNMFRGTTDVMALTYDLDKWIDIDVGRIRAILRNISRR